ncbi:DHA2 family efflux MFS transporter permease subunit [Rhodococcus sp. NPDC060176]|uniref:DHA2 family efflux MFS transporter permease subunit n=1 Tax=Rhodococcus sp. NPDC060176 TaxID=3347062 RepID=UPI003650ED82
MKVAHTKAVSVVYVAVIFLSTMDTTIVNVALPSIGAAYGVPSTSVNSITIAFLVSLAICIPASGWLGDRFGNKQVLLAAVVIFTGASIMCGFAGSVGELVTYRTIQGAGGGMLTPVGMAMVLRTFAPEERVRALSVITIATAIAPTMGPTLGGLIVTNLSWRWVFFVNVPVGVFACVFGLLFVRDTGERIKGKFDAWGFVLSAGGLGLSMYALSQGPHLGWLSAPVLASGAIGVTLLVAMVLSALRRDDPLIEARLFADNFFRPSTIGITSVSVVFIGSVFVTSLMLQDGRHASALTTGLMLLPQSLGVLIGSQLSSRILYRRFGPKFVMPLGLLGTSVSVAALGYVCFAGSLGAIAVCIFCTGVFVGVVFLSTQVAAFTSISSASNGKASTIFNVGRRLGGAVGIAIASTTMVLVVGDGVSVGEIANGYRMAFFVLAAFNVVAFLPTLRLPSVTKGAKSASGARPGAMSIRNS